MSRAWRATAVGEPADVLAFGADEPPAPGEGEVRVQVAANGLNFLDVSICRGQHPVRPELPYVPGAELVGTVTEVGAAVSTLRPGDRVAAINPLAHGCFREEAVVPAYAAYPVPTEIPDEHAAALLVTYQTAYVALYRRANLSEGETVLVHAGAGGLGTALIQLARARGGRVIATAGSDEKLAVCRAQGAEAAVNYRSADFRPAVLDFTDGHGVDVVCDPVGGEVFARSLECVALEGRVLPLGFAGGQISSVDAGQVVAGNYSVVGVSWGSAYPHAREDVVRRAHHELVRMYAAGTIRPFVPRTWRIEQLPEALQRLADGTSAGKSVVLWTPPR
jgi:NADPH2:quinone reductase